MLAGDFHWTFPFRICSTALWVLRSFYWKHGVGHYFRSLTIYLQLCRLGMKRCAIFRFLQSCCCVSLSLSARRPSAPPKKYRSSGEGSTYSVSNLQAHPDNAVTTCLSQGLRAGLDLLASNRKTLMLSLACLITNIGTGGIAAVVKASSPYMIEAIQHSKPTSSFILYRL